MLRIANIYPYPVEIGNNKPVYGGGAIKGGGETEAFDFSVALSEKGHKVTFMTGLFPGISKKNIKVSNNLTVNYYELQFKKNFSLSFSVKMFFDILLGEYDVVHSHQIPIMFSLVGGVAAKISRKKFIITFCGKLANTKIEKLLFYINSLLADYIISQNKYVDGIIKRFYNKKKIVHIPYYVNSKPVTNADLVRIEKKYNFKNKKVILTLCRLIPAKGVDVVLNSFNIIKNDCNAILVIAGTGSEEEGLRSKVKEFGLQDRVVFAGYVSDKDLFPMYKRASVFVLASTYHYSDGKNIPGMCETFALVLGEAMSVGTPVITSAVGGIPCWVKDGYNGLLFKERDSIGLSKKIIQILKDSKTKKNIVINAKIELNKKYSKEIVISQFEKLYTS